MMSSNDKENILIAFVTLTIAILALASPFTESFPWQINLALIMLGIACLSVFISVSLNLWKELKNARNDQHRDSLD